MLPVKAISPYSCLSLKSNIDSPSYQSAVNTYDRYLLAMSTTYVRKRLANPEERLALATVLENLFINLTQLGIFDNIVEYERIN